MTVWRSDVPTGVGVSHFSGEQYMQQATNGDTVQIHYTGTLDDGTVFDSSDGREPLTFTLGAGEVIPGFETAVLGMSVGMSKKERIEAEQAYGERMDDMILSVPRSDIPEDMNPEVGMMVGIPTDSGDHMPAQIVEVTDTVVTIDANHPLAGQALTFDIELVSIAS